MEVFSPPPSTRNPSLPPRDPSIGVPTVNTNNEEMPSPNGPSTSRRESVEISLDSIHLRPGSSALVLGVMAMKKKCRSKPMGEILKRVTATKLITVVIIDEDLMESEPYKKWPRCDVLICFYSTGFPMGDARKYISYVKPKLVNDLEAQTWLWDRRTFSVLLSKFNVPAAPRAIVSRDDWTYDAAYDVDTKSDGNMFSKVFGSKKTPKPVPADIVAVVDKDSVDQIVEKRDQITFPNGEVMHKPFVEKPADADDHNVIIYYHSRSGGGARLLFRKIGDKSSDFDPEWSKIRRDGSYVYEKFIEADGLQDLKAYAVGANYVHCEMRKSPVVDGVVQRAEDGKEVRYRTVMTNEELSFTSRIVEGFKQWICGFDIIRSSTIGSFVCDVNGFSFVKGDEGYYDDAGLRIRARVLELGGIIKPGQIKFGEAGKTILRGVFAVFRHADRTPKQKISVETTNKVICKMLVRDDGTVLDQVELRTTEELMSILAQLIPQVLQKLETTEDSDLYDLCCVALKGYSGTKLQIKLQDQRDGVVLKAKILCKWGGMMTHSGKHQSQALGKYLRSFVYGALDDPEVLLDDIKVKTTNEMRVIQTSRYVTCELMDVHNLPSGIVTTDKKTLDNARRADADMKKMKKRINDKMNSHDDFVYFTDHKSGLQKILTDPLSVLDKTRDLVNQLILNIEDKMKERHHISELCGEEGIELMYHRWKKLKADLLAKNGTYNISKVPDLFDYIKFDVLHNQELGIDMKELFQMAEFLNSVIVPLEYGETQEEKTTIGRLIAGPLLREIVDEMKKVGRQEEAEPVTSIGWMKRVVQQPPPAAADPPLPSMLNIRGSIGLASDAAGLKVLIASPTNAPAIPSDGSLAGVEPPAPAPAPAPAVPSTPTAATLAAMTAPTSSGATPRLPRTGSKSAKELLVGLEDDADRKGKTRLWFTSENHLHALLNLLCGMKVFDLDTSTHELNYLSHVMFQLVETIQDGKPSGEYFVQVSFSGGANGNPFGRLSHWHTLYITPFLPLHRVPFSINTMDDYIKNTIITASEMASKPYTKDKKEKKDKKDKKDKDKDKVHRSDTDQGDTDPGDVADSKEKGSALSATGGEDGMND